jgi:RES domain-containing protein
VFLWRISNYNTLDGIGGLKTSGRWHTRGRRVVYLSQSPSSALLEILVHLELALGDLPRNYKLLQLEAPDDIIVDRLEYFSGTEDWTQNRAFTQQIGNWWLREQSAALLEVPSALAPHTSNFLLNPQHRDAARIVVVSISQHPIDERLLR